MTEDRSERLEGELLAGDCADAQRHFILANHLLFREVVREKPRSKPILVENIIIRLFGLPELHRRALRHLRGIVRHEKRAIQTEFERLLVTNRGRPPAPKQQGNKRQSKTSAAADEQPTAEPQPASQTTAAPQAPLEQQMGAVTHTPLVRSTTPRPKLWSMVNTLELPREIRSLLHAYRNDASDDQLHVASKVCMPWQAYTLPNDVRAALEYIDN